MKKKFLKIVILMIILTLTFATIVNALSFTAIIETSSPTVAESTEFTVTVKVSNLDVGQNGINALSGYFRYDKEIFETISEASIEGINGWNYTYSSDNNRITLTKNTFVKTEESVFNVTLKTKEKVSGKEGAISFTNVMATNSEGDISASDTSITILVGTPGTNMANATSNNSTINASIRPLNRSANNTANRNVSNNTTNKVNNMPSYVNNLNSTGDDIPYTGVEDSLPFFMVGIVILALVFYIKIEKINKEIK